jgi:hypothetical protein
MMMKIKANEELFNELKKFADLFGCDLSSIVQNDNEITPQQLADWQNMANKSVQDFMKRNSEIMTAFNITMMRVIRYINTGQN